MNKAANEMLERNKKMSPRRTIKPTILQGLLVCGRCGYCLNKSMSGSSDYIYYRCQTGKCKRSGIGQEYLDKEVWRSIIDILKAPDLIEEEVKRRLSQDNTDVFQKKKNELTKKLLNVENEINRLLDAYHWTLHIK